jgi:hypothetical protein
MVYSWCGTPRCAVTNLGRERPSIGSEERNKPETGGYVVPGGGGAAIGMVVTCRLCVEAVTHWNVDIDDPHSNHESASGETANCNRLNYQLGTEIKWAFVSTFDISLDRSTM